MARSCSGWRREAGHEIHGRCRDGDAIVINTSKGAFIDEAKAEIHRRHLEMARLKRDAGAGS